MEQHPNNFDRQMESYINTNASSYNAGLGSEICTYSGESKKVKLLVYKVPEATTLATLVSLFSECGTLTNFTLKKSTYPFFKEAVIEYAKLSEAEAAIEKYHNKDPRFFGVVFVSETEPQHQEITVLNEETALTRDQIAQLDNASSSYLIIPSLPRPSILPGCSGKMLQHSINSPNNRQASASRPSIPRTKETKSFRKFDDIIEVIAEAVDFTREKANYSSSLVDTSLPENSHMKRCAVCGVMCAFGCSRCKEVCYCGLECQDKHWPSHQLMCGKGARGTGEMKGLERNELHINAAESERNLEESSEELKKPANSNMYTRPGNRKSFNKNNHHNDSHNHQKFDRSSGSGQHFIKATSSDSRSGSRKDTNSKNYSNFKNSEKDSGFKRKITETKPASLANHNSTKVEPVKRIEAGMVRTVCLAHGDSLKEFWVHLLDERSAADLERVVNEVNQRMSDNWPGLKKAEVGAWCCKRFEGQWSRARVISPEPTIMYVDYGNCEEASLDQLKELPVDLASEPPFAINVHYPQGLTKADLASPFTLRFLSEGPDGLWTVEKAQTSVASEPRIDSQQTEPELLANRQNSTKVEPVKRIEAGMEASKPRIDSQESLANHQNSTKVEPVKRVEAGMVRTVCLAHGDSLKEFWVHLLDERSAADLERMVNEVNQRMSDNLPGLKKAEVGAWCCKRFEGQWSRARVISPEPTIMYVDYGNCEEASLDQLKELPVDLASEPPFAINVHYPQGLTKADLASPFTLRFLTEGPDGRWTVEKAQASDASKPSIDTQRTEPESLVNHQKSTKVEPVKRIEAGMVRTVCLAHGDSLKEFWVHLLDERSAADLERVVNEVNQRMSDNWPGLKKAEVGAWCCKRFEGQWSRARVISPEPTIMYVDYGNCEEASLDQLKELPVDLASEPPFAINVHYPQGLTKADLASPFTLRFLTEGPDGRWTVEKAQANEASKPRIDSQETEPESLANHQNSTKVEPVKRIEAGMVRPVCLAHGDSLKEFWVHLLDERSAAGLERVVNEVNQRMSDNWPGLKKAEVGAWCCKRFEGQWSRARVISPEPTIMYVDYGNCEEASLDQLKELPVDLASEPPFAINVHYPQGLTKADLASPFTLRFLTEGPDGRWTVEKAQASEVSTEKDACGVGSSSGSEIGQVSLPVKESPSLTSPPTPRRPYFTAGEVYEVKMQEARSVTDLYVTKVDLLPEIAKLQTELNSAVSDSSPQLANVAVKSKCAAKFAGEWFRASVKQVQPLTVLYVDYGNEEICKPADVKELPDRFKPRLLTAHIRLSSDPTKEQLIALSERPVKLRVIRKDGSHWLCDFATAEQSSSKADSIQPDIITSNLSEQPKFSAEPKHAEPTQLSDDRNKNSCLDNFKRITDILEEGEQVFCDIAKVLTPGHYLCLVVSPRLKDAQEIATMDLGAPLAVPYRPQMNEMVAVYMNNAESFRRWKRGVVLGEMNGSYSVALVDCGLLVVSNNFRKLPDEFKKFPLMAVKLSFNAGWMARVGPGYVIVVTLQKYSANSREWEVTGVSEDTSADLGVGQLSNWKLEPDQLHHLPTIDIESGNNVVISAFHGIEDIYVQPITTEYLELYKRLAEELAAECVGAKRIDRDPFVGEVVAVKWDQDGKHYRAQILGKVDEEDTYNVMFVDFGNYDSIHISKMKSLSNKLKSQPCCAIKVALSNVIDTRSLTPTAFKYGVELAETQKLLSIEFQILEEAQLITVPDKINISEKINELLEQSWKREPRKNVSLGTQTFPTRQNLPEQSLTDRLQMRKTEKVLVSHVPQLDAKTGGRIKLVVCKASPNFVFLYNRVLVDKMKEYIASLPAGKSYVPRKGELCVCIGSGDIPLRAECVSILNESKALLEFIDFGGQFEVEFTKIFQMTDELMQYAPYAVNCYAEGLPANVTYEKLVAAQTAIGIVEAEIKDYKFSHYIICVPELNALLSSM